MNKRKSRKSIIETDNTKQDISIHSFKEAQVNDIRQKLLEWYDCNHRDLPWRTKAKEEDNTNIRTYAVWVSEIMLQQTQVATVIDYYNKWMKPARKLDYVIAAALDENLAMFHENAHQKWPTVQDLAKAELEEVNQMWSGLGYYSRGRRLHEGACKVVEELGGTMPGTASDLLQKLPGVGRYTAGAIASIALNECTGLVDGNVVRVFSRLRSIGADSTSQHVTEFIWSLANQLVDLLRPGDFNQALMELGATVCTPRTPYCATCPLQHTCLAYKQVERQKSKSASVLLQNTKDNTDIPDIECAHENCRLCFSEEDSYDATLGVMNYPRKGKKKAPREARACVCVLEHKPETGADLQYLLVQRPATGLLAGLWELPSVDVDLSATIDGCMSAMNDFLLSQCQLAADSISPQKPVGEVVHIFSHIHQTYMVHTTSLNTSCSSHGDLTEGETADGRTTRWVNQTEFHAAAVSTAMKKVFKKYEESSSSKKVSVKKAKGVKPDGKKQPSMQSFFKPKVNKN